MPGQCLNALRGNLILPISKGERQPKAIGTVRRAERFEGDGVKPGTADASGSRIKKAFWDFRFQNSEVRWSAPDERTRSRLQSEI
jgi:hypothetical protein